MMFDSSNKSEGPLSFHNAIAERLTSKEDISTEQLILEELRTKSQGYINSNTNAEDTIAIYYYTFLSDFIKHRKKYSLSDKASHLYVLLKAVVDQDLKEKNPKIPGLFSSDKQLFETMLNDFTNAKQLNINEVSVFSVILRYVSATPNSDFEVLFKKFTEMLLVTLLERKGQLVKKATAFTQQFLGLKSSTNSDKLRASLATEVAHVLETFKININKTASALTLVPLVFDYIDKKDRTAIHNHLNEIIASNLDKHLKIKALQLLDELSIKYSLDVAALDKTVECFNNLREEGLFLMLDKTFVRVFLKCYLNVLLNINRSDNSKGRRYFPTLLSLALDILFETDTLEQELRKNNAEKNENVTAVRNKYRLKRDVTHIICVLIQNAVDTDILKYNIDEEADLADLIASIDLKSSRKGLDNQSAISRIMALIIYSMNDNFRPYFSHIDRIIRCFVNQLDQIEALNSDNEMIRTFTLMLFAKIKDNTHYENTEHLLTFLLDKVDSMFVWLTEEMDKTLQNEDFTYLLLLVQKHCNKIKFNSLGDRIFELSKDLLHGAVNSSNDNAAVLNLVRSMGKFKKFELKDLAEAEAIISQVQLIVFDDGLSEDIKRPFIDILQYLLMFCSENKTKLKREFFQMLVRKSKEEILFGNVCKGLLGCQNQYMQICYENILKLLVYLLPSDYTAPMLVNNIRQLIAKISATSDIPKESRIIVLALEATPDLHSHINLYEAATDLVAVVVKGKSNISVAIKLLTSIAHNVNDAYFLKVREIFDHVLSVAQKLKDLPALKAALKFIKDVVEKNQEDPVSSQRAETFLEGYLDFVFLNFKNRNTKTRLIVREIILQSFSKYPTITENNRLFAIILSGLATDKSKGNFIEVLNFILKKRFNDFEPSLRQNIIEILVLLMADKDKSVMVAILKATKTLAKLADEDTIKSYFKILFEAFNEHNPELISVFREKIKKIFQMLIKRYVS